MPKGPVDGWRAGGVVCNRDDLSEVQLLDHGVQVRFLILRSVGVAKRFVRRAPPEKIEDHDAARW
jgi:hypothetical protein